MTSDREDSTEKTVRWRNGHELWLECQNCDDATSLNVGGGIYAKEIDDEPDAWHFEMASYGSIGEQAGLAFKTALCPACKGENDG